MNDLKQITNIDRLEAALMQLPPCDFPVEHLFTPGLYVRTTTLPKGSVLTSRRHLTEHPFVVLSGVVEVASEFESQTYIGPCVGITKPGTKRVLHAIETTVWMTLHANPDDLTHPDEIGERITAPDENPLLGDSSHPRLNQWREGKHSIKEKLK